MGTVRVISLACDNFRRLRAIRWNPGPHSNEVRGRNEQGKTSLLDSLMACLGGARESGEQPIRLGEKSARTEVDLGDVVVRRVWTDRGTHLAVQDAHGNTMRAPQSLLDGLTAALGMDVYEFARADARRQLDIVMGVTGINSDDLDSAIQELEDQRRDKKREAKRAKAGADSIKAPEGLDVYDLEQKIVDLRAQLLGARNLVMLLETELEAATRDRIKANEAMRRTELVEESLYLEWEAEQLTGKIAEATTQKRDRLKRAEQLVAGLEITDEGMRLNGVPISQASAARKILLGLQVLAASNPTLRVALIRDASLLDDNLIAEIEAFAVANDFQILLERVGSQPPEGFGLLIEDGEAVMKSEPENSGDTTHRRQAWEDSVREGQELF